MLFNGICGLAIRPWVVRNTLLRLVSFVVIIVHTFVLYMRWHVDGGALGDGSHFWFWGHLSEESVGVSCGLVDYRSAEGD